MSEHLEEIRRVVALLAERRYEDVAQLCGGSRVDARQLKAAVAAYGRTIVPLPQEGMLLINSVPVQNSRPSAWSVVVPLFTHEEGRSDLSLELTVTVLHGGNVGIQVDNLHVL